MPRTRITTLYALPRREILQWIDSSCRYNVSNDAIECIAEYAGVPTEEVSWSEFEDGDFLAVDGEPVAFIEEKYVPTPTVRPDFVLAGR